MEQVVEITWRVANASLALIAGALLVWSYSERWARLRQHDRMIGMGFLLLLLAAVVAAVEQLAQHTPVGLRTFGLTVALVYLLAGLVAARRYTSATS